MTLTTLGNTGFAATGAHVEGVRLFALKGALRLEKIGMRRRGPSALSLVKDALGMKRNAKLTHDEAIARIEQLAHETIIAANEKESK